MNQLLLEISLFAGSNWFPTMIPISIVHWTKKLYNLVTIYINSKMNMHK